jgi:hypothetical protein
MKVPCFFPVDREIAPGRPVWPDCVHHHPVLTNSGGFRVGRNPRNSGRLVRGVAVCEPNSGLSPRSEPEIARQSQPAKFRFPDHEMEKAEPRLSTFR